MASREIFADTSGLYALVNKRDPHHMAARACVEGLVRQGRTLVSTDLVVAEAATLARIRGGDAVAVRLLDLVDRSAGIRLEWIDRARFDGTKAYFRKHLDHDYSFTDCSSFVVMRELRLRDALTSDRHFSEAGFEVLLRGVSSRRL
jgi:predicted nucleic acid-binding protein